MKPFQELKEMLINREYTHGIVNSAITKAKAISRLKALRRVSIQSTNTINFVWPHLI